MAKQDKGNCFVVMPFGRTDEEIAWFAGWYKECLSSGVKRAGYTCVLSAAESKPIAINDDIRAHLVFDPMVICDLGGMTSDDPPNPNVMYELGIRHAFGHPLVIMGWKGQRIPFDVANQRVILENRRLLDVETNIDKVVAYIEAAEQGDYLSADGCRRTDRISGPVDGNLVQGYGASQSCAGGRQSQRRYRHQATPWKQ